MSSELATVDVERLVRGVFRDEWMAKTGIGGVLTAAGLVAILYSFSLIPITVACWALIFGYSLRCMRVKIANAESKLPDWNDLGDLFLSGLTWIALQSIIWACFSVSALLFLLFAVAFAFNMNNSGLSLAITVGSSVLFLAAMALMAAFTAYVMVHFSLQENAKAGFAYIKVAREFFKSPRQLLSGFILATSIQFLFVAVPCITIIGIFVLPSSYFVGTLVSSVVLARHWSTCNNLKYTLPLPAPADSERS